MLKQDSLIKTFNDICYLNRKQISKIPDLANTLHWEKSKDDEMFGIKKYSYNNLTIMTKSDFEEELCIVGMSNDNKYYGFALTEALLAKFPPIGKVLNTQEYWAEKELPTEQRNDIETDYIKTWYIEGGYKIVVALLDYDYRKIDGAEKRSVTIQLFRF